MLLFCVNVCTAQTDDDLDRIVYAINMDSVVFVASKAGFNVKDFIDMVQNDTTFYQGFKNLRTTSYAFNNDIKIMKKNGVVKASYSSDAIQISDGICRQMTVKDELVQGKYYKRKGKLNYYTAKLYERLFFTKGEVCENTGSSTETARGMEKHVAELKKMIFQPGQKANVPLIGNKTAIFSKRLSRHYDFSIESREMNGQDCYVFIAQLKPEMIQKNPDIGVVKYLSTYFRKDNFQIVKRRYLLSNNTFAYNFNVEMDVDMIQNHDRFYPSQIQYKGIWKIPTQKRERANFKIKLDFNAPK